MLYTVLLMCIIYRVGMEGEAFYRCKRKGRVVSKASNHADDMVLLRVIRRGEILRHEVCPILLDSLF